MQVEISEAQPRKKGEEASIGEASLAARDRRHSRHFSLHECRNYRRPLAAAFPEGVSAPAFRGRGSSSSGLSKAGSPAFQPTGFSQANIFSHRIQKEHHARGMFNNRLERTKDPQ